MELYSAALNDAGTSVVRVLGGAVLGYAAMNWFARNAPMSDALRGVLLANLLFQAAGLGSGGYAAVTGIFNSLAWSQVALHLVLGLGFAYFGFFRRASPAEGALASRLQAGGFGHTAVVRAALLVWWSR